VKKKYCVEFGKRGGYHTDAIVMNTERQARLIAANFVRCSIDYGAKGGYGVEGANDYDWYMTTGVYRKSWQSATHFVAVTLLGDVFDDMMRGPASQHLWKLNDTVQGFKEEKRG
jgi:hypothetical protein